MNIWLIFLLIALGTFSMRYSFIYLLGRYELPATFRRALRFVPPTVLVAIVLPALVRGPNGVDFSFNNARLVAGLLACVVAYRSKNVLLTLAFGMVALFVWQAMM